MELNLTLRNTFILDIFTLIGEMQSKYDEEASFRASC